MLAPHLYNPATINHSPAPHPRPPKQKRKKKKFGGSEKENTKHIFYLISNKRLCFLKAVFLKFILNKL